MSALRGAAVLVAMGMVAVSALADPTTYYVDPTNGNDSNSGTSRDLPLKTMLAAYNKTARDAGDEIVVLAGTHVVDAGPNVPNWHMFLKVHGETGDPKDTTIISDGGDHRFLLGSQSATSNLTVYGFTFCNFTNSLTGAVLNFGQNSYSYNPVVSNCVFRNCHTSLDGGAIYSQGDGVRISNCHFENCTSKLSGGAINHYSRYAGPCAIDIRGCTFTNCQSGVGVTTAAAGSGGAVFVSAPCDDRIVDCTFSGCRAVYWGGAVCFFTAGYCHYMTNCTFFGNAATGYENGNVLSVGRGGAVYNHSATTTNGLVLDSCTFTSNFVTMIKNEVKNVNAANNPAMGGAVYGHLLLAKKCDFTGNYTEQLLPSYMDRYSFGAAWACHQAFNGRTTFEDCRFIGNYADGWGGAIYYLGSWSTADGKDGAFLLTNCLFEANSAYHLGSVIMNPWMGQPCPRVQYIDTVFRSNTTSKIGLSYPANRTTDTKEGNNIIDIYPQDFTMRRCRFEGNATYGNAVFKMRVRQSTFGTCTVEDCQFTDNRIEKAETDPLSEDTAGQRGCVFHFFCGQQLHDAVMRNCLFARNLNNCSVGGAVLFGGNNAKPTRTTIENCDFIGNTGTYSGSSTDAGTFGGIYITDTGSLGTDVFFRNLIFADNHNSQDPGLADVREFKNCKDFLTNCLFKTQAVQPTFKLEDGAQGCIVGHDPKFKDAAKGDYRIRRISPARDAGIEQAWMREPGAHDLSLTNNFGEVSARIYGPTVDIGCYEWSPTTGLLMFVR